MTPILIGILGILMTAYAAYLLNSTAKTKEEFLKAAVEFRKPFIEIRNIFDLSTRGLHEKTDIRETFILYFSNQKSAVSIFVPILPRRFRERIRDAWKNYENYINNENTSKWFDSDNLFKTDDEILEKRKAAINKIDRILLFSDYHNIYSILRMPRWKV
jgi:hypothetical protein